MPIGATSSRFRSKVNSPTRSSPAQRLDEQPCGFDRGRALGRDVHAAADVHEQAQADRRFVAAEVQNLAPLPVMVQIEIAQAVRLVTGRPRPSRTVAATATRATPALNTGRWSAGLGWVNSAARGLLRAISAIAAAAKVRIRKVSLSTSLPTRIQSKYAENALGSVENPAGV